MEMGVLWLIFEVKGERECKTRSQEGSNGDGVDRISQDRLA